MDAKILHPLYPAAPHSAANTGVAPGRGMNSFRILCRFTAASEAAAGEGGRARDRRRCSTVAIQISENTNTAGDNIRIYQSIIQLG